MSKEQNLQKEKEALHIGVVSKSFVEAQVLFELLKDVDLDNLYGLPIDIHYDSDINKESFTCYYNKQSAFEVEFDEELNEYSFYDYSEIYPDTGYQKIDIRTSFSIIENECVLMGKI